MDGGTSRVGTPGAILSPPPSAQPITGYRNLSADEVALVNEAKALAQQCGAFIERLRKHPDAHRPASNQDNGLPVLEQRWVSIGATDLQRGWMAIVRSIAQPTTF